MSTNLFVTQAANSLSTFLPFRLATILTYSFTDFRALYNHAITDWGHSQVLRTLSHQSLPNSLSMFLPFRLATILTYSFTDFRALYNHAITDWGHSQVLRALSHLSLRAAQASIIELGRAIDNCRSSYPQVDLEGAILEDGPSIFAGNQLVAQLSNPAFVRNYDILLVTELAEEPPMRTYVAEEAAFHASSSAMAAEASQPERSVVEDIKMAEGAAGPGPVGPHPCTPCPSPFEPPSSASKRKRRSFFFIFGHACLSIGFIDDKVSP